MAFVIFCAVSPGLLRNCVIDSPSRPIDGAPDIYIYIFIQSAWAAYMFTIRCIMFSCVLFLVYYSWVFRLCRCMCTFLFHAFRISVTVLCVVSSCICFFLGVRSNFGLSGDCFRRPPACHWFHFRRGFLGGAFWLWMVALFRWRLFCSCLRQGCVLTFCCSGGLLVLDCVLP